VLSRTPGNSRLICRTVSKLNLLSRTSEKDFTS
jgi:hypothetical protein